MPALLLTSELRPARTNGACNADSKTNSEWFFSFRGDCESDSDSSDEEPGPLKAGSARTNVTLTQTVDKNDTRSKPKSSVEVETEDARLLRELDIASRENVDAAQFTATPWSIARVNAASRAPARLPIGFVTSTVSSEDDRTRGGGDFVDSSVKPVYVRQKSVPAFGTRREAAVSSVAAADGPKKANINPKLGKTIERFFAAQKLDKGNFKGKPKTPGASERQIRHYINAGAHSTLPPQNTTPGTSTISSSQSHNAPFLPPPNSYPPSNQAKLVDQSSLISPTYTAINIARATQFTLDGISTVSPANNTVHTIFTSDSNDTETLNGSELDEEVSERHPYSAPCNHSSDILLAPSTFNPLTKSQAYARYPSIYAKNPPFDDMRRARTVPPEPLNGTQAPFRHASSQPHLSRVPFSSPLSHDGDEFGDAQSFSSPIKQATPGMQHPGRAALGLAPPIFQDPGVYDHFVQSYRPKTTIGVVDHDQYMPPQFQELPFTTRHVERSEPVQDDNTTDRVHVTDEQLTFELPVAEPDSAFVHSRTRSSVAKPSPPSLSRYHADRSSPSPIDYPRRVKRAHEPTLQKVDAYAAFAEDEEASWSTLPGRKKARTQASFDRTVGSKSMKQSGRFKLPIALPSLAAGASANEAQAAAKRRVVTYLPPPRDPPPQVTEGSARETGGALMSPKVLQRQEKTARDGRIKDVNVIKPVSEWSIKRVGYGHGATTANTGDLKLKVNLRGSGGRAKQLDGKICVSNQEYVRGARHEDTPHKQAEPAGPARSDETDATLCSSVSDSGGLALSASSTASDQDASNKDNGDVSVAFDTNALERAYPEVRKAMLEVRSFFD